MAEGMNMNIDKTAEYYHNQADESLCRCAYCRNYYREIRQGHPQLADYLGRIGIDIEKPFEVISGEPWDGYIEYLGAQYIVFGDPAGFQGKEVNGVEINVAESHPVTDINEQHFVIEVSPIRLKWTSPAGD